MFGEPRDDLPLQGFFLGRLRRFVDLASRPDVVAIPRLARLSRRAALSAYRDCVSVGVEGEARALLARHFGIGAGAG